MKTILAAAALTLSLGAPALADPMAFAIAHFNQDRSPNERIAMPEPGQVNVVVSTRGTSAAAFAVEHFNQSADAGDVIRAEELTLVSGTPRVAADIFEEMRAADDDN